MWECGGVGVWESGRMGEWAGGESDVGDLGLSLIRELLSFLQAIAVRLPVWIPNLLFSLPRFRFRPIWIAQLVGIFSFR